VGVAIGTTTNLKFVQPSVNLRAAMAHQYQEPIFVGSPVVVDSSGVGGIFWTGDDALAAAYNADMSHIKIGYGTYGPFNMSQGRMWVQGSGRGYVPGAIADAPMTLIDGNATAIPIIISTPGNTLSDLAVYTAPGGGGGGFNTISITHQNNWIRHVSIVDSDGHGIYASGSGSTNWIDDVIVQGADVGGITFTTGANRVVNSSIFSAGTTGFHSGGVRNQYLNNMTQGASGYDFDCDSEGDNSMWVGNISTSTLAFRLNTGCDNSLIGSNVYDGTLTNSSTGSTVGNNEGY